MERKERGRPPVQRAEARPVRDDVERFYKEVNDEMRRLATHIVGHEEADDVVQDAFVKFLDQRERALTPSPRQAGKARLARVKDAAHDTVTGKDARLRLLTMVRDTAIDRHREMARDAHNLQLVTGPRAAERRWANTRRRTEDNEIRHAIHTALGALPRYQRDAWLLARECELSIDDTAAQLRIEPRSCSVFVSRANRSLESRLAEVGLTPRTLRGREVE